MGTSSKKRKQQGRGVLWASLFLPALPRCLYATRHHFGQLSAFFFRFRHGCLAKDIASPSCFASDMAHLPCLAKDFAPPACISTDGTLPPPLGKDIPPCSVSDITPAPYLAENIRSDYSHNTSFLLTMVAKSGYLSPNNLPVSSI